MNTNIKLLLIITGVLNSNVNSNNLQRQLERINRRSFYQFDPRETAGILGAPSLPSHLPEAEPILPGHTLLKPALGMLKSSVKFPHRDLEDGSGVYGHYDNIGIRYDSKNERVLYSGFRRSNGDVLENYGPIYLKRIYSFNIPASYPKLSRRNPGIWDEIKKGYAYVKNFMIKTFKKKKNTDKSKLPVDNDGGSKSSANLNKLNVDKGKKNQLRWNWGLNKNPLSPAFLFGNWLNRPTRFKRITTTLKPSTTVNLTTVKIPNSTTKKHRLFRILRIKN